MANPWTTDQGSAAAQPVSRFRQSSLSGILFKSNAASYALPAAPLHFLYPSAAQLSSLVWLLCAVSTFPPLPLRSCLSFVSCAPLSDSFAAFVNPGNILIDTALYPFLQLVTEFRAYRTAYHTSRKHSPYPLWYVFSCISGP